MEERKREKRKATSPALPWPLMIFCNFCGFSGWGGVRLSPGLQLGRRPGTSSTEYCFWVGMAGRGMEKRGQVGNVARVSLRRRCA
eukprot:6128410-Prymnesium_polylepis.1